MTGSLTEDGTRHPIPVSTRPSPGRLRPRPGLGHRAWIPTVVVVALAGIGPLLDHEPDDPCRSTDGPQFACWLEDNP